MRKGEWLLKNIVQVLRPSALNDHGKKMTLKSRSRSSATIEMTLNKVKVIIMTFNLTYDLEFVH